MIAKPTGCCKTRFSFCEGSEMILFAVNKVDLEGLSIFH